MNHEYTNLRWLFANGQVRQPGRRQQGPERAWHLGDPHPAHRRALGDRHRLDLQPRLTGSTPMLMTGPAAGNTLLQTTADPTGSIALGTPQQLRQRLYAVGHLPDLRGELQPVLRHAEHPRNFPQRGPGPLRSRLERHLERKYQQYVPRFDGSSNRTKFGTASAGSSRSTPSIRADAQKAHRARTLQARERRRSHRCRWHGGGVHG